MNHRFKKEKLYIVEFLDHASGVDHHIVIRIVGWFIKETEKAYVFSPWVVQHEDRSLVEGNYEYITIVKELVTRKSEVRLQNKWQ